MVWLGILANFALAVPTLIAPERLIAMAGLPPASPLMWVRFSAWLLILLSFMYMPGAVDLYRYRAPAWLSVTSRLAGVLFFATQAAGIPVVRVVRFRLPRPRGDPPDDGAQARARG